jgi:formate dehydrogenase major subunit
MGGSTSSYREVEEADIIVLWGSNARETHPIFFHHVLKALKRGAKLVVVDPRRTTSADWSHIFLPLRVGTDIALSNAIAREILHAGLQHTDFIENATSDFDAYRASVEPYTLEHAESVTGVSAASIAQFARLYASAPRAEICWTLGITEHHNAVDNVLALINLGLLTGHVGRYGSGLNPLRGQNNVQGGGDMGALPDRLPGFQHVENAALRAKFETEWAVPIPPSRGMHLSDMMDAVAAGDLDTLYVIGENPAQSEANQNHATEALHKLKFLVVQDVVLTATARMADVFLPSASGWNESEGTVTNSERKVQRVRRAVDPPPGVRDDLDILYDLARRLGRDWGRADAEAIWNEVRRLSPMHCGMSYARLEADSGLHWPCYDESHPGEQFLHSRLWSRPAIGPRAPFSVVEHVPPVEALTDEYPLRLTTGRRLDSYNTGVQSGALDSPLRRRECIDLSSADAAGYNLSEGEIVRVSSRRGSVEAPVHIDPLLPEGLAFMTLHDPDQVPTNKLTLSERDVRSGTPEFKAAAIRIDKVEALAV